MGDLDQFSDLEIVAKTLDGEAGDQGYEGQQAVANVIGLRASLKWQGEDTLRGVCLHPYQFSCWLPGPDRDRIIVSENDSCLKIAELTVNGTLPDITNGADSYEVTGTGAYWSYGLNPVTVIGKHSFYITRAIE
jgi:spore germination cell wall hydrolase CwlJ-like protein